MVKAQLKAELIGIKQIIIQAHNVQIILEDALNGVVKTRSLGIVEFTAKQKKDILVLAEKTIKELKERVKVL